MSLQTGYILMRPEGLEQVILIITHEEVMKIVVFENLLKKHHDGSWVNKNYECNCNYNT